MGHDVTTILYPNMVKALMKQMLFLFVCLFGCFFCSLNNELNISFVIAGRQAVENSFELIFYYYYL